MKGDTMEFQSPFHFQDPDVNAYEAQKDLHIINSFGLPMSGSVPTLPTMLLGNGTLEILWREYYGRRLVAAIHGSRDPT